MNTGSRVSVPGSVPSTVSVSITNSISCSGQPSLPCRLSDLLNRPVGHDTSQVGATVSGQLQHAPPVGLVAGVGSGGLPVHTVMATTTVVTPSSSSSSGRVLASALDPPCGPKVDVPHYSSTSNNHSLMVDYESETPSPLISSAGHGESDIISDIVQHVIDLQNEWNIDPNLGL